MEASILVPQLHGDGIGKEEIKFLSYMPMDSRRRGSALKVTVHTIAQMSHFEEVIVRVL